MPGLAEEGRGLYDVGRPESATATAIPDAVTGRVGELELDPGEITSTNAPEGRCDGACASAVPENIAMRSLCHASSGNRACRI